MEDFEIIFNDNEPEIKVSIDKTYSMRDFKKMYMKILDEIHREQYEKDKRKWVLILKIDTTLKVKKPTL